jgi:hypothetical protein
MAAIIITNPPIANPTTIQTFSTVFETETIAVCEGTKPRDSEKVPERRKEPLGGATSDCPKSGVPSTEAERERPKEKANSGD